MNFSVKLLSVTLKAFLQTTTLTGKDRFSNLNLAYATDKKKMLVILLMFGISEITCQTAGIRLMIGQHGLNEAMSYIMSNDLEPNIQNDLDLGDYSFRIGLTQINVTSLRIHKLSGYHGNISVFKGNRIETNVGFNELVIKGIVISKSGAGTIRAPNTVVHLPGCRLHMIFTVGMESLILERCKASVGNIKVEGKLGPALEGVFALSGEDILPPLIEKVCPNIDSLVNAVLGGILSLKETVTFSGSTLGDIMVNLSRLVPSTESGFIIISAEVATDRVPINGDIILPSHDIKQLSHDVVLQVNDQVFGMLCHLTILYPILEELHFEQKLNEVTYRLQINSKTVQDVTRSSELGTIVIWNATFDVYTNNCRQYTVALDSVIPMGFHYNNSIVIARADLDRLQMEYTETAFDHSCESIAGQALDVNRDVQKNLSLELNCKIATFLKDKAFFLIFPRKNWYGLKEAHVKTVNGGLEMLFGIDIGAKNETKAEGLKRLSNKNYVEKLITLRYRDGQTVRLEIRDNASTTEQTSGSPNHCLFFSLMIFSIMILCCF